MTQPRTSWQMLRALRHDPPNLARCDLGRRGLFSAALEQAEQFFRAAEATDAATRPLLLFYGLSQSGRALRAAADPELGRGKAGGHGIRVLGLSGTKRLSSTAVADQASGLFRDMARTLSRATVGSGQRVGDLTRVGRLGSNFPLSGDEPEHPPLQLRLVSQGAFYRPGPLRAELIVPSETWARELPPVGVLNTTHYEEYKEHVRSQLAHYPTLQRARLVDDVPGYFELGVDGRDRTVPLEWPDLLQPPPDGEEGALHAFSDERGRQVTVYPNGSGSEYAVHPYLLWWAVLYAMSQYVRYEPTHWAEIIDVNHSDEAVAVEVLCDEALDLLPGLIHRTITRTGA